MLVENLLKVALLGSEWVMWLLLGLSVVSLAITFDRWRFFSKNARRTDPLLGEKLSGLLARRDLSGAEALWGEQPSVESQVIAPALGHATGGSEALSDAIVSEFARRRLELERGMNFLGTVGSNAPFIGLLGTVIGVIDAFNHLGSRDDAAMDNVMAGIAEALVATGVGLFVAIPAVIAFNVFQKKIMEIESRLESISRRLSAELKSEQRGADRAQGWILPAPQGVGADTASLDVSGAQPATAGAE